MLITDTKMRKCADRKQKMGKFVEAKQDVRYCYQDQAFNLFARVF